MFENNDYLAALCIAGAAILFMVIERFYAYNKGQKLLREGFWLDMISYNFVQSAVLGVVISFVIQWIDTQSGFSRMQAVGSWPIWVQVIFFLVIHDFYIYWMHRAQHMSYYTKNKFLWRIHEAHHSVKEVDWLSGVRSHPLEILINQTVEFMPIIFLGAAPEVAVYKGIISAVWGMFIHANWNFRLGPLKYIINGPEMHRWHHAVGVEEAYDMNYSTKFSIWDFMFGSAYVNDKPAEKYGVAGIENFPQGYWRQTFFAFRPAKDGK